MKDSWTIRIIAVILTGALFLAACFDLSKESVTDPSFVMLIVCLLLFTVIFAKKPGINTLFCTFFAGVLLKLTYVMYTPVWCRQHDVVDFGAGEGHAAYIEYILSHKALPDFDPRSVWAFFQPPLHHIISAVWMWFNIRLGLPEKQVFKNVQILPLVYMCLLMLVAYLICRQLNMSSKGTLAAMLITSFHPIYILMSGSINNDALCVLLSVVALYAAICWYLYPTTQKIILLALAIGLGMCAKLSAALVAPAVGVVMIYKILRDTNRFGDRQKVISYILELIPFVLIVFPLGLWWSVRNSIRFGMPAGYIPEVGEHVERFGFVPTILDVRTASPFLYMKANGFAYDEYNLVLAAIKSSLFGEGDFAALSLPVTILGWILFASAVLAVIVQVAAMIRVLADKEAGDAGIKILLAVTVVTFVGAFIAFALKGANLSAMDLRYAAPVVVPLSVFTGRYRDRLAAKGRKRTAALVMCCCILFAVSSAAFYVAAGIASA